MAVGWAGATPVQQDDGAGTFYELGQSFTVNGDVTITGVRVWHGASTNTVVDRSARIWTPAGAVAAEIDLTDTLPPGWTTFSLDTPLELPSGTSRVLSFSTRQFYGAVTGGYPATSADGLVTYTAGGFNNAAGLKPDNPTAAFYGVDLVYDAGIGGNVAPAVTLAATVAGRTVTATASVTDENPGTVSYRWEFGDGTTVTDGAAVEQHTYAADGIYAVLVVATDAGGLQDSAAVPVLAAAGTPGGMDLEVVLRALADRLDTIPRLQVHVGAPLRIRPPAAVVAFPEGITFDRTYGRGSDSMVVPVVLVVSKLNQDGTVAALSEYASGSGDRAVKSVLESGVYPGLTVTVTDAQFDVYAMAGDEYMAAVFNVSVMG